MIIGIGLFGLGLGLTFTTALGYLVSETPTIISQDDITQFKDMLAAYQSMTTNDTLKYKLTFYYLLNIRV